MPRKEITSEVALSRLESLCSRSEQCEFDLERKLYNWGIPAGVRKEIIEKLRENRYVDNSRFAKSYSNDKARFSHWGPQKIRIELIKRKIPAILISEALRQVDSDVWREGLLKNASSKAKSLKLIGEDSRSEREKLYRYLISRGFPSSSASKAVSLMVKRQESQNQEK